MQRQDHGTVPRLRVFYLFNSLKAPYNISNPTSQLAIAALQPKNLAVMQSNVSKILEQRERMLVEMPKIPGVGRFRGGRQSNFLLVEMLDGQGKPSNEVALAVYEQLAETKGVVVRFRGKELGCFGCLRVTVGTEEEVTRFLKELATVLREVHNTRGVKVEGTEKKTEEKAEQEASAIIA